MVLPKNIYQAQSLLRDNLRAQRLHSGFTQAGLATRAGVSLASLRKFEQQGSISLASFLKLCIVLDTLEPILEATTPNTETFNSMDELLAASPNKTPKKGWRT